MKDKECAYKSVFLGPFVSLRPSLRAEARIILIMLSVQTLMLFVTRSYSSLVIILASLLASYAADFLSGRRNLRGSFAVISNALRGILTGFMIPAGFPPAAVFFVALAVFLVSGYMLGGSANSWAAPPALTAAICWVIGMRFFPEFDARVFTLQSRNIALSLIQDGTFPMNSFDVAVTNFLNRRLFSLFGISIPEGYFSLFWDTRSAVPAFRFNLLTLLSSVILLGFNILNPIIPSVFILTYALLVKIAAPFFYGGPAFQGDILLALLSSGTLFGAFFLLQWHGTTPFTDGGRWLYGILAGAAAFLILGIGLSPSGFAFMLLIMSVISLFIQNVERHFVDDYTNSVLMPRVRLVREGKDA